MARTRAVNPLSGLLKDGKPTGPEAVASISRAMRLALFRMNRVQEPFIRAKNQYGRTPKRRIFEAGEKSGKTFLNIGECLAHAMGFRPWLKQDDPDYKISVRVPNHGLMGCETMAHSVEAKIRPELEALIPDFCEPDWKNDTTGALKQVTLKRDMMGKVCGSTLHIRSYNQPAETFRGIDPNWISWDEPPPEDILKAAERGKVVTNAPSWFAMTPLKEAYIYDMFSVKAFNNGGIDPEIAIFKGSMWDNCQDWCRPCDCYIPENDPDNMPDPQGERPVNKCPECGQTMGFMARAGILEYIKLYTDPDEIEAHIEGKWAHLSGLIYKNLNHEEHEYEDFEIPKDWMRIEVLDPHDARPCNWLFGAVSPEEILVNDRAVNRIYWYSYLRPQGTISEISRQVRIRRAEHNYQEPKMLILDAKFGRKTIRTGQEETCWEDQLIAAGIGGIRLSHSNPGDIAIGHKMVKEYLKPHYSALKGKSFPGMMFAKEGCRGEKGPLQSMFNYQWDLKNPDKPAEAYKDFPDCVRYAALEQPAYIQPESEEVLKIRALLGDREQKESSPLLYGLRIAGE